MMFDAGLMPQLSQLLNIKAPAVTPNLCLSDTTVSKCESRAA
jgi:hypothetical protein